MSTLSAENSPPVRSAFWDQQGPVDPNPAPPAYLNEYQRYLSSLGAGPEKWFRRRNRRPRSMPAPGSFDASADSVETSPPPDSYQAPHHDVLLAGHPCLTRERRPCLLFHRLGGARSGYARISSMVALETGFHFPRVMLQPVRADLYHCPADGKRSPNLPLAARWPSNKFGLARWR